MRRSNRGLSAGDILAEIQSMYDRRGDGVRIEAETSLREVNFRSLDFSELALRIEQRAGRELNFSAGELRRIETVRDVIDFFQAVLAAPL